MTTLPEAMSKIDPMPGSKGPRAIAIAANAKAVAMLTATVTIVSVAAIFTSYEIFNIRQVINPTIKPITPEETSVINAIDDTRPVVSISPPTNSKPEPSRGSDSTERSRTQNLRGNTLLR